MGSLGGRIRVGLLAAWLVGPAAVIGCGDEGPAAEGAGSTATVGEPGGGDGTGEPAEVAAGSEPGLPPCDDERHMVVLDINGTLGEVGEWFNDPDAAIQPYPGAVELAQAYASRGYELLYVAAIDGGVEIAGTTVTERLDTWFEEHGFPAGESLYSVSPDAGTPLASVTEELLNLGLAGVEIHAGYTNDPEKARAFVAGGVPRQSLYAWEPEVVGAGHQELAEADFRPHVVEVEELPSVCAGG